MRRALLLVLLLPALPLVLAPTPAFACSCKMATAAQYAEDADVVVLGAVEEVRSETARLRVDRVLKGDVDASVEVINGDCNGPALGAEQKGAFFLERTGQGLRADLCGGSGFVKPREAVAALGAGTADHSAPSMREPVVIDRDEPAQSAIPVVGVVGFLALAGVVTAVVVRRRRL